MERHKKLHQLIKTYSPILLADDEDVNNVLPAVKKWLQQKLDDYKYAYSSEGQASFDAINELLEELEQEQ